MALPCGWNRVRVRGGGSTYSEPPVARQAPGAFAAGVCCCRGRVAAAGAGDARAGGGGRQWLRLRLRSGERSLPGAEAWRGPGSAREELRLAGVGEALWVRRVRVVVKSQECHARNTRWLVCPGLAGIFCPSVDGWRERRASEDPRLGGLWAPRPPPAREIHPAKRTPRRQPESGVRGGGGVHAPAPRRPCAHIT